MAISSPMGPGFLPSPEPLTLDPDDSGAIRLCEFTIAYVPEARQLAVRHSNPLCALFAQTEAGARVCDRGCGIGAGETGPAHVCPFGMAMHRLPDEAPLGRLRLQRQSQWIGRRFVSASDFHAALDLLVAEGIDEQTILDRLPANPVIDEDSLADAASDRTAARIVHMTPDQRRDPPLAEPARTKQAPADKTPASAPAAPSAPGLAPLDAVLEYLSQTTHLISAIEQPTRICDRFLKAAGAALPFEQSTILLRRRVKSAHDIPAHLGHELVPTAAIPAREHGARSSRRSPLSSHELGPIALAEGRAMIERDGHVSPLNPHDESDFAGATIGIPLVSFGGEAVGVWLGKFASAAPPTAWGQRPIGLMRLLAELLAARLQQVMAAAPPRAEQASPSPRSSKLLPVWSEADLLAALRPEAARAQRFESMLALIHIRLAAERKGKALPVAALAKGLRAALRPYDLAALADDESGEGWHLIVGHAPGGDPERLAARLQTLIEDVLDANGGLEERGLKVAIGLSTLGADAADPRELAAHAAHAAREALARAEPSASERYRAPERAQG